MRILIFLPLLFLSVIKLYAQNDTHLFRIIEDDRIGYMDSTGKIIVQPRFKSAGEFSEGLAAARLNGIYGYIDRTGEFIIPATYDYAEAFHGGMAVIYLNDQLKVIDKTGDAWPKLAGTKFVNGVALLKGKNNKYGLIDRSGNIVLDPRYSEINDFIDGLAIVQESKKAGVIDSKGQFRISVGRFDEVESYKNGYFTVRLKADKPDAVNRGFVDSLGRVMFLIENDRFFWIAGYLSNGLARIRLAKPNNDSGNFNNSYTAYINTSGHVVIDDTTYRDGKDFSCNRAFVQKDGHYIVIDTKGLKVAGDYDQVHDNGFKNGLALVETEDGWGLIDTNGNYIVKPQFDGVHQAGIVDEHFFFSQNDTGSDYAERYGVATITGKVIVPALIDELGREGFYNALLKCIVQDKLTYINESGDIVWQEKRIRHTGSATKPLDIDHMNRGYFYAYSKHANEDKQEGIGGYARSDNYPPIAATQPLTRGLIILVDTLPTSEFAEGLTGHKVFVLNNSTRDIEFNAQDSRIEAVVQARDIHGKWKDIEYLTSSFCGNSYHTVILDSGHYWEFLTPAYKGSINTKFRIKLSYIASKKAGGKRKFREARVYSNEYEGSVNPAQFWRKAQYYRHGLMDPYID